MHGSSVLQGIRDMITKGYITSPVPQFYTSFQNLGTNHVDVDHGKIYRHKNPLNS